MKQPLLIATGIGLLMCLYSCGTDSVVTPGDTQAYVPVYMSLSDKNSIAAFSPRTTEKSGKIYAFGKYIFQNDLNKGIHIIDNSDRAHPQKIAFINIPYNTEFAVKGNYIYANNLNDLVVINISDLHYPVVVKRMENAFPYISQQYPPHGGYFVCPDPAKGIVVDWVLQTVNSPACKR